jgi:transposase InsO family protein
LSGSLIEKGKYRMNLKICLNIPANIAVDRSTVDLWHRRLGHATRRLVDKVLDDDTNLINLTDNIACTPCIEGKITRDSFPVSTKRAEAPAELIHFDVCGPVEVKSFSGFRYLCLFTDDFSGYIFGYFLKNRSEIIDVIKSLIVSIKSHGHNIRRFRSDNSKEFTSQDLSKLLLENGIAQEYSSAYCPEQNGRAERQNRTVVEMARTMKIDGGFPSDL